MPPLRIAVASLLCSIALAGCAPNVLNAPRPGSFADHPSPPPAGRIELEIDHGILHAVHQSNAVANTPPEDLQVWVDHAVAAVSTYYGYFPVEQARLIIEPVNGSGLQWARTFAHSGFFIRVGIGSSTTAAQLDSDWMLTHEFVHLTLPTMADEHDWLQEGAATYVEPIARAQAGQLSAERVWSEFVQQMPHGLPGPRDRGLDFTSRWGRIYWGGALFCLTADIEIRQQTDNHYGLRDALRAILDSGGTLDHQWTIREALSVGDRGVGVDVLTELYEKWRATPVRVDLETLWSELGIRRAGRGIVFDDGAPLARIRQSITARSTLADTAGPRPLVLIAD